MHSTNAARHTLIQPELEAECMTSAPVLHYVCWQNTGGSRSALNQKPHNTGPLVAVVLKYGPCACLQLSVRVVHEMLTHLLLSALHSSFHTDFSVLPSFMTLYLRWKSAAQQVQSQTLARSLLLSVVCYASSMLHVSSMLLS